MVPCVLFIIVLLGNTRETKAFTHIAGVVANGKPILRSISQDSQLEVEPLSKTSDHIQAVKEPDWLKQLRKKIFFALNGYGFEEAKAYIEQLVEEAEKATNTLLHVKGFAEPPWLSDFKTYVHQLVSTHGPHNIDTRLSSVIKYIQKNNDVRINDVDVNEKGDVFVDYTFIRKFKKITTKAREANKLRRLSKDYKKGRSITVLPLDSDSD